MAVLAFLLNTRLGHALGALVVVCGLLAGFRWKILADARERQAVAALQAQLATTRADLAIAKKQADDAHARAALIESAARGWTEKVDDLQKELAARDGAPRVVEVPVAGQCPAIPAPREPRIDADGVRRLRAIAR